MAVLNFPDTSGEATDGTFQYTNPNDGAIYKWDGNAWSLLTEPISTLDAQYVEVAGDNMTGNLTLATNKIILKTDGEGQFQKVTAANQFQAGGNAAGSAEDGIQLNSDGTSVFTGGSADELIKCYVQGDSGATIILKGDGSASFAGRADIGSSTLDNYSVAAFSNSAINGGVYAQNNNTSGKLFTGQNATSEVFSVKGDGSASFYGGIIGNLSLSGTQTGGTFYTNTASDSYPCLMAQNYNNGGQVFQGRQALGDTTSRIYADGSAEFEGNVQLTNPRNSTAGEKTGGLSINPSDTTIYYNFRVDEVDNDLRIDTSDGADKIKFSVEGSAMFAGGTRVTNGNAPLNKTAFVQVAGSNDEGIQISNGTKVKTSLSWDGSAKFDNEVISGENPGSGGAVGTLISQEGFVAVTNNDKDATVFYGFTQKDQTGGSISPTTRIKANGNTSFGSETFTGPGISLSATSGNIYLQGIANDASAALSVVNSSDYAKPKAEILHNGSATFASTVTAEDSIGCVVGFNRSYLNPGNIDINNATKDSTQAFRILGGKGTADEGDVVLFRSDGSATFAGGVGITNDDRVLNDATLILNNQNPDGYNLNIQSNGTTTCSISAQGSIYIGDNSSPSIELLTNGSATFAGLVDINGGASVSGGALAVDREQAGNTAFSTTLQGTNTVEIQADGSATFAGTVTANGTILTRAGGTTLDVGDRLEKVDAALTALKSAAAAASDFSTLKSAIATALADI